MKFELINNEGCVYDTIETTSFEKARTYFASQYEGKYIILCEGERKNVEL